MIRYIYIENLVFQVYSMLPQIKFPIDVQQIINLIPNCRYMSYQKFSEINNCSLEDVIQLCESKSGCTHYDINKDRYLILCNQSVDYNNKGRQLWTSAHEVGHILCKHHAVSAYSKLSENGFIKTKNQDFENEADYFAATLLAPFPFFELLNIKNHTDVQEVFGLSNEASVFRYNQYLKWKRSHRKTAWENKMLILFNKNFNSI